MKTRTLILSLFATAMVACTEKPEQPEEPTYPTQEELQSYRDTLLLYYPYSLDEEFVFVNEELGQTWKAKADDQKTGMYPIVYLQLPNLSEDCDCKGMWSIHIFAPLLEQGLSHYPTDINYIQTDITGAWMSVNVYNWEFQTYRENGKERYQGGIYIAGQNGKIDDILNTPDTIIVPIPENGKSTFVTNPEGAYARIVKHQGLTDFSVDGKTVWKRIK